MSTLFDPRDVPKTRIRGSRLWLLLGVVAVLLTGCGASDDGASTQPARADTTGDPNEMVLTDAQLAEVSLQTIAVEVAPVTTTLELPARIRPGIDQEAYVTSLVAGRIDRLRAQSGDRVRRGEVLAEVAAPDLSDLVAQLRQARDDWDRQRRLQERGVAIEKNVRAAERGWQAARQRLRSIGVSAEQIGEVAAGEVDLSALPLTAPIDGVVLDRSAVLGAPVQPGDRLYHVADLQPIRVVADVFERNLEQVREGQAAQITTPMNPKRTYRGTIDRLTPQVEDESRAATARVMIDNEDGRLRPGMYATVRVSIPGDPQPSLPASALLTDAAGSYVLLRVGEQTFRRVPVAASADVDGRVAVPELSAGAVVVTEGAYQIVSAMNQR